MGISTRPTQREPRKVFRQATHWFKRLRFLPNRATESSPLSKAPLDPRLMFVARRVPTVTPQSPVAAVLEQLKSGPYHAVPVIGPNRELRGLVTETTLIPLLLSMQTPAERTALREWPVERVMTSDLPALLPGLKASETAPVFAETGVDTLPVVDYNGTFLGLVSRSDLVQELTRPFRPPTIGGMATPGGVYLTTGNVSGGVRPIWLAVSGVLLCLIYFIAFGLTGPILSGLEPWFAANVPVRLSATFGLFVQLLIQVGLLLVAVRFSPVAGYHAAEHQVVHAVERGEPLTVNSVREMPRVHPRCGTNLVAGAGLLLFGGLLLEPLLGAVAYIVAGAFALAAWRTVGAWLQANVTTRPATDAQLESGIRAAREVLESYQQSEQQMVPLLVRVWRMGFFLLLLGFAAGCGLLYGLALLFPKIAPLLRAFLEGVVSL